MESGFAIADWAKGSNIYEVNVRQYTPEGTLNAFAKELPRLKQMGVEILWFMPLTPISVKKRLGTLGSPYAASDYQSINPEFGSLEDFAALVEQAHNLKLKVIIDWVANHTGWDHTWTIAHPKFYKRDNNGNFYDANGWADVIDLDYTQDALREAMVSAMKFWIDRCNIDGFRCDMAHLVPLDFWVMARTHLNDVKPGLFWLAETENMVYHLAFDALYGWELLHTMEDIYKGSANIQTLDNVLQKYNNTFPLTVMHLAFTTNHDENSHSGSEYERMGDGAKAFAVLTATWTNCMPLVYSGQELPNKKRLKFFDKDTIEWTGQNWLNDFYRSLLQARRQHPALHGMNNGVTTRLKTSADDKIFAFMRQANTNRVLVLLHLTPTPVVRFSLQDNTLTGNFESIFSGMRYLLNEKTYFEMKAWDYLVYSSVAE